MGRPHDRRRRPVPEDAQGKSTSTSTLRKRCWKNEAAEPYPEQRYGKANVARMRHWRFRCSDGTGGSDFDDLVFTARIIGE